MHGIKRGTDGAAVEQHVIDEHNCLAFDIERHLRRLHVDDASLGDVISVHADVEHTDRRIVPPDAAEQLSQAPCQMDAAALDADQSDALAVGVGLGDFVRNTREAALDRISIDKQFCVSHGGSWRHKKTNQRPAHGSVSSTVVSSVFACPLATSQDRFKGIGAAGHCPAACWLFRHLARWLRTQSINALSNPMSRPSLSDSSHLCRSTSSRSARYRL